MQTAEECLACFTRQIKYAARLATTSQTLQQEIEKNGAGIMASFNLELSPPENAVSLYRMVAEMANNPDIFAELKNANNQAALKILPELEDIIARAGEPLQTAALLAIAGNVIDYGSHQDFDINQTISECMDQDLAINDFAEFKIDLQRAEKILYLGDNCGELVFDSLLIRQLEDKVTFATRERPIINDALRQDAETCGLHHLCKIISNGTDCPGTPIEDCNDEFKMAFKNADLIISKGQGNFETLSQVPGPIYFLLMVKCEVVAQHLAETANRSAGTIRTGDRILMKRFKDQ